MFKNQPFLASAIAVACVACGASFTSHESGNGAVAGSGNAGEASGGLSSSAGSPSIGDAGEVEAGGTSAAGQGSTVGGAPSMGGMPTSMGGMPTGIGGMTTGMGGRNWGNGGRRGGGADCTTLEADYNAAVEKARACTNGSLDECSASSVAQPVGGCGCPVLINAKSEAGAEAKRAYQAYQDAKCASTGGPVCNIYCPAPVTASCAQQQTMGGPGGEFVCTAGVSL